MMGKWYEIKGITKGMFNSWKDDLRQDIVIWEEDGKIEARIRLTRLEAFILQRKMVQDPYGLRLVKVL